MQLWAPVIAYMAMLFWLSSFSRLPSLPGQPSDYYVHFAAYIGLAVVTTRATTKGIRDVSWRAVIAAVVISSLYGVSDEYHQLFVPGRSFDVFDMLADTIGSIAGASAVGAWSIIRHRF